MTTQIGQDSFAAQVAGPVLCYAAPNNEPDLAVVTRAAALTGGQGASGLVVRGPRTIELLRRLEVWAPGATRQPVVVDPGTWMKTVATADVPLGLPADEDVLIPLTRDQWARWWLAAGTDGLLTPSGFVESGDWPAVKAVLGAAAKV